ncbi:MAG: flagellin, partial [Mariprofundales bacterium]
VTASDGSTGTGTISFVTTTSAATADTQSGTINIGSANAAAKALITNGVISNFAAEGQGKTFDIKVDQFGAVQVLDGASVVGTGLIDSSNLATSLTAGTDASSIVSGANTGITTVTAISTAQIDSLTSISTAITSSETGANDKIQISVGTDGKTLSFQDLTTSTALTVAGAGTGGASLAAATMGFSLTNAATNLTGVVSTTTAVLLSNGQFLAVTFGANFDTTHFGGSSGGTITGAGGTPVQSGTLAITLNQGTMAAAAASSETMTITIGGKAAELGALTTGYQSAGTVTTSGGAAASSTTAASSEAISLSDGTLVNVTYAGTAADVTNAQTVTLGASSGTVTTDYTAALDFQVGADNTASNKVSLDLTNKYTTTALGLGTGDLLTQANAQTYIDTAKAALNTLITQRADLGATQNQVAFIQSNLATNIEQSMASVSSIRDADMAAEMANFTKNKILTQAGTSMLAQANQAAQNILTLFR